jgi:hypothetical protein
MRKKDMRKMIALLEQSRDEWVERGRIHGIAYREEIARLTRALDEYQSSVEF